jgi:hypothetical protein
VSGTERTVVGSTREAGDEGASASMGMPCGGMLRARTRGVCGVGSAGVVSAGVLLALTEPRFLPPHDLLAACADSGVVRAFRFSAGSSALTDAFSCACDGRARKQGR